MRYCVTSIALLLLLISCSPKKDYSEIQEKLSGWSGSIKQLDYLSYASLEAYPKNKEQFMEMYKDYYIEQLTVIKVEEDNETILEDHSGKKYIRKKVYFSGMLVMRKQDKPSMRLQGDVEFIKFNNEEENRGWLLANRTFIRTRKVE